MDRLIAIGQAAKLLGVSISTLRRWEQEGKITLIHTKNGHRRYNPQELQPERFHSAKDTRRTIAYARVSSFDQKKDLERQKKVLEMYCAKQGWTFEILSDLGSGMNYYKKGLKRLLNEIIENKIGRLVLTHTAHLKKI